MMMIRDWTISDRAQDIWWIAHEWMSVVFHYRYSNNNAIDFDTCMGAEILFPSFSATDKWFFRQKKETEIGIEKNHFGATSVLWEY